MTQVSNVRAILVGQCSNGSFMREERGWEFHIEYQRLLKLLNAIHQFGQS
jgi:hypothetical protein